MLNRTLLTSAALGATLFGTGADAAAFKPTDVPSGAQWVVHLDVEAARSSKIAQAVQSRLLERDEVKQGVSDIETLTGLRLPDDVNDVTLYGKKFGEENNVILISGKFDRRRILGLVALNPEYTSTMHGEHEIVSWDDKGKINYGTFVGEGRVVIARSLENVSAALDVLDLKQDSLKSLADFGSDVKLNLTSAMLYIGGTGLEKLPQAAPASPILQQARSAIVLIGEDDGQAFLRGLVKAADATKAEQLARAGEGLRSIVQLGASRREADHMSQLVGELMQTLKIDRVDQTVTLDWKAPATTVVDLIDEGVSRRGGGPDGQGVHPRTAAKAGDTAAP